ncbi:MAG TPA: DUF3995 domain-containing protein [Propionibacteriaceae bacterium]|jgi:hypothetical protein|nr:DUF3995 domain-containing protein [Propionibacteriaceae bacterium]
MVLLAVLVATVLAALSILHLYWVVGGRWGHAAALPERNGQPMFRPGAIATLLVAALLTTASVLVLGRVGLGPAAQLSPLTHIGAWIIAVTFLLRGVGDFRLIGLFRRVRDTRFAWWDRHLYTPLSIGLGLAVAVLAASTA